MMSFDKATLARQHVPLLYVTAVSANYQEQTSLCLVLMLMATEISLLCFSSCYRHQRLQVQHHLPATLLVVCHNFEHILVTSTQQDLQQATSAHIQVW